MSGIFESIGAWVPENIIPVALGVVALGIVVFIHELGHYFFNLNDDQLRKMGLG